MCYDFGSPAALAGFTMDSTPEDSRREQILLYGELFAEQQRATTSDERKKHIRLALVRIREPIFGLYGHDHMMAEYVRLQSELPKPTDTAT